MQPEPFTPQQQVFIRSYAKHLEAGNAAVFAGAGLSRAAGFVDWKDLLKDVARDLGLDVNRELDLVALAQFNVNYRQNRSQLNEAIIDNFFKQAKPTSNHYLLARMPIQTIWTTNYDQLIERAFEEAGKVVDVKLTTEDFGWQRARDVILYKMHGDVRQPQLAVLTKDDYESYEKDHPLFVENLKLDLVTKTFLFLGLSFTDPNMEYILGRVRMLLGKNAHQHFAIMKDPDSSDTYGRQRLEFWKADLRRFGVETVAIKEYSEVEKLLAAVSMTVNRRNVFVAGSSREFAADTAAPRSDSEKLGRLLGQRLIETESNLVSGFGVGIGEQCVLGALRALYSINDDARKRVIVRPFPTALVEEQEQRARNTRTRWDLISRAGTVVFIAGNKIDSENKLRVSQGVLEEFGIAKELQRFIIPVAVTGYAAAEIWKEVTQNPDLFYPGMDVKDHLQRLADPALSVADLAETVLQMVQMAAQARES